MKNNRQQQFIHVWAQQNHGNASKSHESVRYTGKSIYSYNAEIARFINHDIVVISNIKHSVTTSNHTNCIINAVSHKQVFYTDTPLNKFDYLEEKEVLALLVKEQIDQFNKDAEKLKTKKKDFGHFITNAFNTAANINNRINKHDLDIDIDNTLILDLCSISTWQDSSSIISAIKQRTGIDIQAKIDKELLNKKNLETKKLLAQKENLDKWLKHEFNGSLFDIPIHLRINKADNLSTGKYNTENYIETTKGAIVPLEAAKLLYKAIRIDRIDPETLVGYEIGAFRVAQLTQDEIIIGCHTIPLAEADRVLAPLLES